MKTSKEKVQEIIEAANVSIDTIYGNEATELQRMNQQVEFLKIDLRSAYETIDWKQLLYDKQEQFYSQALKSLGVK